MRLILKQLTESLLFWIKPSSFHSFSVYDVIMYVHTHMETRGGCWETSRIPLYLELVISARIPGQRDPRICLILPHLPLGNKHTEASFHCTWNWRSKGRPSYFTVSIFTLYATCHAFICSWNPLEKSRVCHNCLSNKPICSFVSKQSLSPSSEVHIYLMLRMSFELENRGHIWQNCLGSMV